MSAITTPKQRAIALARKILAKKPPKRQTSEAFVALLKALYAVEQVKAAPDDPEYTTEEHNHGTR